MCFSCSWKIGVATICKANWFRQYKVLFRLYKNKEVSFELKLNDGMLRSFLQGEPKYIVYTLLTFIISCTIEHNKDVAA